MNDIAVQNKTFEFLCIFILWLCIQSCIPVKPIAKEITGVEHDHLIEFRGHYTFNKETIFEKNVILYPSTLIRTIGEGKLVFNKSVKIIGDTRVFADDINLQFNAGTITELNACWFGAGGQDDTDDVKSIIKVFAIADEYPGSINIYFPSGRYFISRTLQLGSFNGIKKSINLIGGAMSDSGVQGASISWIGSKGSVMIEMRDVSQCRIENLDFIAEPYTHVKHNLQFTPFIHQVLIENCSFTGAAGEGSANLNINSENNLQVSEIQLLNAAFKSVSDANIFLSPSAVIGGLANTKNFYFSNCSFIGYTKAAIDIAVTDVLTVEKCTFAYNEIDISCMHCGTYASSNYSEHSKAFFNAGITSNPAFATLTNNRFSGNPRGGYVVRDGSGSLVLINNHFGASGYSDDINNIGWAQGSQNPIFSVGNYYKNASLAHLPFRTNDGSVHLYTESHNDAGGNDYTKRIMIHLSKN